MFQIKILKAHAPSGVLFLTLSRRRSPVAIEHNCGKRFMSLSDCVPFPTPGAPTRMILAALFSFRVAALKVILGFPKSCPLCGVGGSDAVRRDRQCLWSCAHHAGVDEKQFWRRRIQQRFRRFYADRQLRLGPDDQGYQEKCVEEKDRRREGGDGQMDCSVI